IAGIACFDPAHPAQKIGEKQSWTSHPPAMSPFMQEAKMTACGRGCKQLRGGGQKMVGYLSKTVSLASSSATNTESRLAGSVALAFSLTLWVLPARPESLWRCDCRYSSARPRW